MPEHFTQTTPAYVTAHALILALSWEADADRADALAERLLEPWAALTPDQRRTLRSIAMGIDQPHSPSPGRTHVRALPR